MAVTQTKADGKQVFRLRDIETEEVSIVDRPANLQPFLIVKRDTGGASKDSSGSAGKSAGTDKAGVGKAGAKMSKENFGKLSSAIQALLSLQGSLAPQMKEKAKAKPKTEKREGEGEHKGGGGGGGKRDDELHAKVDKLTEKIASQDTTIGGLRKQVREYESRRDDMPGSSQALEVETTKRAPQDPNRVTWPRDLTEPDKY